MAENVKEACVCNGEMVKFEIRFLSVQLHKSVFPGGKFYGKELE